MKKVFKMKLSKISFALLAVLWVAIAALLVFTVVDMLTMSGFDMVRLFGVITVAAIFSFVIVELYRSNYKVLSDGIEINISILRYKIDIAYVVSVKYLKTANKLALVYVVNDRIKKHYLQLDEKDFQSFVIALKDVKPSVIYEEEA